MIAVTGDEDNDSCVLALIDNGADVNMATKVIIGWW